MSDEEREALRNFKSEYETCDHYSSDLIIELDDAEIILNLIEKQSKEIEELKEDRKKYAEEYIHNNPWLYKQLNEVYILRSEAEQKEKQAWIEGTNVADKLCNKKWKDKIKAKIEKYEKALNILLQKDEWIEPSDTIIRNKFLYYIEFGQSLLEKE